MAFEKNQKIEIEDVKNKLNGKVDTSSVNTLEEIMGTTDLTGKVASASSVKDLNEKFLVKGFDLMPADKVYIYDIFSMQGIVYLAGAVASDIGTGVAKPFLTLANGYKVAAKFFAPISCYGGIDGEIGGDADSNIITLNISQVNGEGKFNFFFRVKKNKDIFMIKIKYNNQKSFEEVSFSRNNNVVTITPTTPNTNGFTTWRIDGVTQLGDFSDFNTVFKVDGDSVTYSNDGSIYIEPPKPTEEDLRRQALLSEKAELETWLKEHDYIGTKIATGRATIEEYAAEIAEMAEKANRINDIDKMLE